MMKFNGFCPRGCRVCRLMTFVILGLFLKNISGFAQEHLQTSTSAQLLAQLSSLEERSFLRLGLAAKNLRTGELIGFRAAEKFPTASAIKVPIMVEYFYQVRAGRLSPDQLVVLADSNKWGGSGILQYFRGRSSIKLADAMMLMITVSDNSGTNLVLDALGGSHEQKLAAVNERMIALGLKNTRLLNKLMSWPTKKNTPESLRYGVGVSTPADMILLLEKMYRGELVDSAASREMVEVMSRQQYNSMIPRFLPWETEPNLRVAHKTGSVTGVRVDVGLVLSPRTDFALAIFCDEARDQRDSEDNLAELAVAKAARLCWNYFTGDSALARPFFTSVDWQRFPAGEWARLYLRNSPFPHPSRDNGYTHSENAADSTTRRFFPRHPHYDDSTAIVIIPKGYHLVEGANDLIIHFHGWWNEVDSVMESFGLVQQLLASRRNAILVLAQGPYRAPDSHGGKMEDPGGLRRFVEEILQMLKAENKTASEKIGRVILSAHSGGYRPLAFAVAYGGLAEHIRELFLFDAFYAHYEKFIPWLKQNRWNRLRSIYTGHLAGEHRDFMAMLKKEKLKYSDQLAANARIVLLPTTVCHNCVMEENFKRWLEISCLAEAP
ncbi:MAG: class A beta-lactamase-related serine hydrolase [candidate division KSB1 bacterium]|nr:class A beta-lactamase-related serine hydrolase [candidate division KSB1 bacterium]MDZ7302311.1 class A beta-lactamase-related serine hydrolase [candidate division KSB1 bacterium]MDZ7311164.1 class A beta-lactamase-related serine hydrolase [candidate division KSB1 bacterium]